jgi:pyrimidine operon attenuation protein/uracil phosphoribosyltransferase
MSGPLPDAEALLAELVERMAGAVAHDAALVGIYSGGAWIADRLAAALPGTHPVGYLDVAYYRDDYQRSGLKSSTRRTEIDFPVEGATIVLCDDVLYTGRSVRAAINELFDFGRPAAIELAVLVDRGGRELPIQPTYVGGRLVVAESLSIVLSCDADRRLALAVEAA